MNRRDHIFAGLIITGLLHTLISAIYHVDTSSATDIIQYIRLVIRGDSSVPHPSDAWFFGALFGAMWADMDFVFLGTKNHRNSFFHSSMLQIMIFAYYLFNGSYVGLMYFYVHFFIASSTHLFLDLVPTSIPDEFSRSIWTRWEYRVGRMKKGYVGSTIKSPPVSVTKHKHQRTWFLGNGFICLILGLIMLVQLITGLYVA